MYLRAGKAGQGIRIVRLRFMGCCAEGVTLLVPGQEAGVCWRSTDFPVAVHAGGAGAVLVARVKPASAASEHLGRTKWEGWPVPDEPQSSSVVRSLATARTGAPLGSAGRSGQEQGFLKSPLARGGDGSLSPRAVSTWDAHGAAKPRGTGTTGEGSSSP